MMMVTVMESGDDGDDGDERKKEKKAGRVRIF